MTERALSSLIAQGWEMEQYSATSPHGETVHHCFLMRRQSQRKVLTIRKKIIGKGVVVSEMEV